MKRILLLIVLIGIASFSSSAQCLIREIPLEERIENSLVVFEGRVLSSSSVWDVTHSRIFTVNRIEVYKVFKGTVTGEIELVTEGGIIGNVMHKVEPSLQLSQNDVGVFTGIPAKCDIPGKTGLFEAFGSVQGFIRYDLNSGTSSDPFHLYSGSRNDLYQRLLKASNRKTFEELKTFSVANSNKLGSTFLTVPTITSFAPATITSGTGSILTINGSGFQATRGTGYVEFRNADDGGVSFIQPLASDYVSWSDVQIQVKVPTKAGTGTFRVVNSTAAPNSATSASSLTVTYAQLNVTSGGVSYKPDHVNDNGTGGYTFQMETSFAGNAAANASFKRALETWRCNTYINWDVGANTGVNVTANDGTNVVRFDSGAELPAGVLGVCSSYWSSCAAGVWYVTELDITFDSGTSWQYGPSLASGAQYDFESVALHELGHGHQLGHVINAGGDVMHYAISNGANVRTLTANNVSAGNYVMSQSTVANACGSTAMIALNSGNCALGGPTAAFTGTPLSTCASSLTVNFTDNSTGSPTSWAWDIDNNGTTDYTTQNPSHTYATPGIYSVKLTVCNGIGCNTLTNSNYVSVGSNGSITSIASGNWNNTATWSGGVIPGACDLAIINHTVTVSAAATVGSVTVNSTGILTATAAALTNNGTFTINAGGTYNHGNISDASTTIFKGTESFDAASNINVTNWYNFNVPFAQNISGHLGNLTINLPSPGGPPGSTTRWDQDGQFTTHLIRGTLTTNGFGVIYMDDGTGNTNSLTLNSIVMLGSSGIRMRTAETAPGTTIPGGTFTLITGSISHNGGSQLNLLWETAGTLNWTANGSVTLQQDFYATKGANGKVHVTNAIINGDLNISMTGADAFDMNYQAVGASHVNLTVTGTTRINNTAAWVKMVDAGLAAPAAPSTGNVTFNTGFLDVSAGLTSNNNSFQMGAGSVTMNVTNDINMSGTSVIWMINNSANTSKTSITVGRDYNSSSGTTDFRCAFSNGPVSITVNRNFNQLGGDFTGQRVTTNASVDSITILGTYTFNSPITTNYFYGTSGDGDVILNTSGDFRILSAGNVFLVNQGDGDLVFTVGGQFKQAGGAGTTCQFRGIYGNSTTAGTFTINMGSLDYDGGLFMATYGCNSTGATGILNIAGNCEVNFIDAVNIFRIIGVASFAPFMGAPVTSTLKLDLDIAGDLIISGVAGNGDEFTSSVAAGIETVDIIGNVTVSGGVNSFNVAPLSGISANGHATTINIGTAASPKALSISGGSLHLSGELGTLTANINGNVSVTGGTLGVKGNDGLATVNILNGYSQTGGIFYLHDAPGIAAADATADIITININSDNNATGDFSHTGGTMNYDDHATAGAIHKVFVYSPNYTLGGAGSITRGGAGTANLFGELHFSRGAAGTTLFSRTSTTHSLQQVKQYVDAGTTVSAVASASPFQIASNATQANITTTSLVVNGTLDMGVNKITAVGPSLTNYYSGISISSGGKLITANLAGFYDGSVNACLQPQVFATNANYRMDFNLDASSTVEYKGVGNQVLTGKYPNVAAGLLGDVAAATTAQYKYGILDINHQGIIGTNYAYPAIPAAGTGNVFVRTLLRLTLGELNLSGSGTGQTITVENPAAGDGISTGAILSTSNSYVKSEENFSGNNRAKIQWNIGAVTGAHIYPFGLYNSGVVKLPVIFNNSGASGNVTIATRTTGSNNQSGAAAPNNFYSATNVAAVSNMYDGAIGGDGSIMAVIDRWWDITSSAGSTIPAVSVGFTYQGVENTLDPAYQTGTIAAQHWDGSMWELPVSTGSMGVTSGTSTVTAAGLTKFSPYVLSALAAPLPVQILSFTAECSGNEAVLKWITASEENNSHFVIEKSANGKEFFSIATVKGAGTSNKLKKYQFSDTNPFNGISYYRLKQTDFNDKSEYFDLVALRNCSGNGGLSVYPNPVHDQLKVDLKNVSEGNECKLIIHDATGKIVYSKKFVSDAESTISVNTEHFCKGVYYITVINSENTFQSRFIKN